MNYQPLISRINHGLISGWKCQISGREWSKVNPTRQEMIEFLASAESYSRATQSIMDRTVVDDPTTLLPQLARTLVDRKNLYSGNAALVAQVESELGL